MSEPTISDQASAMRAVSAALTRCGLHPLDGYYDPHTGHPTPDPVPGRGAEHFARRITHEAFTVEADEHGCESALHRIYTELHTLGDDLHDLAEILLRAPTTPDHT